MTRAERHVQLLVRCYPQVWRERYGEELAALLADDLAECPRSLTRDADVLRAGLRARAVACGLIPGPVRDPSAARVAGQVAAVAFVAAAVSIWTQLADGWLTTRPDGPLVGPSLLTLSLWITLALSAGLLAGARMAVAVACAVRAGRGTQLRAPLAVLAASAIGLVGGVRLVAPLWPGARPGQHQVVLPVAARIGWAMSDPLSTYWVHPHRLAVLPAVEMAWMLLCPVWVAAFVWAAVRLARACPVRMPDSDRRWRGSLAGLAGLPILAAAGAWVLGSQHAANATYRAGTLDLVLIAAMLAATLAARNALTSRPMNG